jgi:hypothetical protein
MQPALPITPMQPVQPTSQAQRFQPPMTTNGNRLLACEGEAANSAHGGFWHHPDMGAHQSRVR